MSTKTYNSDGDYFECSTQTDEEPLVKTGPGGDYTKKWFAEDFSRRWEGFEGILIGGSVISFVSGLLFGSLMF